MKALGLHPEQAHEMVITIERRLLCNHSRQTLRKKKDKMMKCYLALSSSFFEVPGFSEDWVGAFWVFLSSFTSSSITSKTYYPMKLKMLKFINNEESISTRDEARNKPYEEKKTEIYVILGLTSWVENAIHKRKQLSTKLSLAARSETSWRDNSRLRHSWQRLNACDAFGVADHRRINWQVSAWLS